MLFQQKKINKKMIYINNVYNKITILPISSNKLKIESIWITTKTLALCMLSSATLLMLKPFKRHSGNEAHSTTNKYVLLPVEESENFGAYTCH